MHTAVEKQSPGAVGVTSARSASAIDTAVEAADERPHLRARVQAGRAIEAPASSRALAGACRRQGRAGQGRAGQGRAVQGSAGSSGAAAAAAAAHFLMSAPPRVATLGVNSSRNHLVSLMRSMAGTPPMRALTKSGTWVVEWLPHTHTRDTEV